MKAHLLHADRDVDLERDLGPDTQLLVQDLELDTLFDAMAGDDRFVREIVHRVVLDSLRDPESIRYRQDVLRDCLAHPAIVKEMYGLAVEAVDGERKIHHGVLHGRPSADLRRALEVLEMFLRMLTRLRDLAGEHAPEFESHGLNTLCTMLVAELDDPYLRTVRDHLNRLRFRDGILLSAKLGPGNKARDYVLLTPPRKRFSWSDLFSFGNRSALTFQISDRDINGANALAELRDRGIDLVANALTQSTAHILSFFEMLRSELAFYVGCLDLHERLDDKGAPMCLPEPLRAECLAMSSSGLYDPCLRLRQEATVVGNDIDADDASLVMITGANQGGKSTFLRSVGVAQLMMQCGMFVPAHAYRANVGRGLFTHFKREEDPTMRSGKLDEELGRMSDIADRLTPGCIVLFNESFASTNEREGSQIAGRIVRALVDARVKVFFVTHMYDLAHGIHTQDLASAVFLKAPREPDGRRSYRLAEGEPLPTSYGDDLYRRIFGASEARLADRAAVGDNE